MMPVGTTFYLWWSGGFSSCWLGLLICSIKLLQDANQVYVQNAVYGQQSYAGPASIDVRQKPLGGRDTSYAASRFETGQVRRTDSGRNARVMSLLKDLFFLTAPLQRSAQALAGI
jgi:hypothetical protein